MFLNDIEKEKPRASMLQLNTLVLGRVPSMDSNRVGMGATFWRFKDNSLSNGYVNRPNLI